jgi:chemotaxis protein MotB
VLRVQGLAASQLINREQPADPANRRISIVVMNREAEERVFRPQIETGEGAEPSIKPDKPMLVSSQPMAGR